ncbi:pyridoxine 4-dehydrogenase [Saccharomycopsis crataegensis]|uniref:Pyridoxine 4-dehydrogenase n=1 Tax=Saccharomycopsis crataegensis TaxID=43959 RepID=A0AAV5QVP1_9ASCO|nr:pyridoxine 4-dehydrogenase [Saccharomycopsis crataegensis]
MTKFVKLSKDIVGFGTMRTTWTPHPVTEAEAVKIFYTAYKSGCRLFNGGEFYGADHLNLKYLQAFIDKYPEIKDEIVISIKGGINMQTFAPDGSEAGIKTSIENCLKYLNKIDVFECARVDKSVPIEDTLKYINQYIEDGKIGGVSLSEAGAETIRKAAKAAKISFVEVEYSLWSREILDNGVAEACAELNIPIVAYSPLGCGFLAGSITSAADLPEGDMRKHFDRFTVEENVTQNNIMLDKLKSIATEHGLSLPQLSLAWIKFHNNPSLEDHDKFPQFIPIPGSLKAARIKDNSDIKNISLPVFNEIQNVLKANKVAGIRYNAAMQGHLFG